LRDGGGQIHIPIDQQMQKLVDSSDHGRRNKGEMQELVGLARWRRSCGGTFDATADKISLVTSNGLRHMCSTLAGSFSPARLQSAAPDFRCKPILCNLFPTAHSVRCEGGYRWHRLRRQSE